MSAGLLGIEELDRAEIEAILARAKDFQPIQSQTVKKLDTLRGKRSEEHTSELQSLRHLVCRLLLEGHAARTILHSFPPRGSSDLIEAILGRAKDFQPIQSQTVKKLDTLRGKMIVNLFYEASTRTRTRSEEHTP